MAEIKLIDFIKIYKGHLPFTLYNNKGLDDYRLTREQILELPKYQDALLGVILDIRSDVIILGVDYKEKRG